MNWWEDEDNLAEIETPECFESGAKCERCILIARLSKTILSMGRMQGIMEGKDIISYWVEQIIERYGIVEAIDSALQLIETIADVRERQEAFKRMMN